MRTVYSITRSSSPLPGQEDMVLLRFESNGFLKQMVRNMAGLLAACGRHKLRPDQIPAILEAADRRALPSPTAPPQGLALAHVEYPD